MPSVMADHDVEGQVRILLPVLTIGEPNRIFSSREYAHQAAERLLEYLDGMDSLRGTGRLFLP